MSEVARVVGELVGPVGAQPQVVGADPEVGVPAHPLLHPVLMPLLGLVGQHEELHLHLLELTGAKDEVSGRDLVPKRLADLGDAEGRLAARELKHVLEVDEDPLSGLRSQVGDGGVVDDRADMGLEHEVELARLGEVAVGGLAGMLGGLFAALGLIELVGSKALLAGAAVDQRVREPLQVPGRLPGARVLEDRRVQRHDVVAVLDHRPPPLALDVVAQQHAVVAVVVGRAQPTVDLRGRKDEAATLAERHDLVHRDLLVSGADVGRRCAFHFAAHRTGAISAAKGSPGQPGALRVA